MAVSSTIARDPDCWEVGRKMANCAYRLRLAAKAGDVEAQELLLQGAYLCQQRLCPFCEWRRVRRWRARLIPGLQAFHLDHPKRSALFLTLTVRNVPLGELRPALQQMHAGWNRLTQMADFPTAFWLRRSEITIGRPAIGDSSAPTPPTRRRSKGQAAAELTTDPNHASGRVQPNDTAAMPQKCISTDVESAPSQKRYIPDQALPLGSELSGGAWVHPHIHALLLVPARYWTADYIRQKRWQEMWWEAARLDYAPVVDVRRARAKNQPDTIENQSVAASIEASKYTVKHADLLPLGDQLGELHFQLRNQRMIAVSSKLSAYVKGSDPSGEELLDDTTDALANEAAGGLYFHWDQGLGSYVPGLK